MEREPIISAPSMSTVFIILKIKADYLMARAWVVRLVVRMYLTWVPVWLVSSGIKGRKFGLVFGKWGLALYGL